MNKYSRIYIAGHNGLVGSNLHKYLRDNNYTNIITACRKCLDLRNQEGVRLFFEKYQPEYVFNCAAKVGGIKANMNDPLSFLLTNLQIQNNIITYSIANEVKKVVNLGSSCIYPKDYKQPLKEEYLLHAPLEPTNEAYALAKIVGLKLCEYANKSYDSTKFVSLMPCNLYGPGDNYDLETSHVLGALIAKVYNAKKKGDSSITIWGDGTVRREFLHINDLINAMMFVINNDFDHPFLNVGSGIDISIKALTGLIMDSMEFSGDIKYDLTKPIGMKQKCLDVSLINSLGWKAKIPLHEGISRTTYDYKVKKNLEGLLD